MEQSHVSVDTQKRRETRHVHDCVSFEVSFKLRSCPLVGQVEAVALLLLCVFCAGQELSAQVCFSFGEVGPPCSRHVLFRREGLGRSRKDPPVTVSWPKNAEVKAKWLHFVASVDADPKNLHDVMFLCHCRAALCHDAFGVL